jgi:AraC family transcriptional regulator of adaptative response/methylated-DNA-[protein]-cysteine methyltransferase
LNRSFFLDHVVTLENRASIFPGALPHKIHAKWLKKQECKTVISIASDQATSNLTTTTNPLYPNCMMNDLNLKSSLIDTPLGSMLAISDDRALYLIEFIGRRGLEKEIERLKIKTKLPIVPGKTNPIEQIQSELNEYFSQKIPAFKTPFILFGTPFQKRVWEELQKTPYGETRSYAEIAKAIGRPSAFRAVALANSMNQFAIMIPCHRVINTNGALGGYAGGVKKKEWLLAHERK